MKFTKLFTKQPMFTPYSCAKPDGAGWTIIDSAGADEVTYTDSGLAGETVYYYRLAAFPLSRNLD